jgi:hypothetical protein
MWSTCKNRTYPKKILSLIFSSHPSPPLISLSTLSLSLPQHFSPLPTGPSPSLPARGGATAAPGAADAAAAARLPSQIWPEGGRGRAAVARRGAISFFVRAEDYRRQAIGQSLVYKRSFPLPGKTTFDRLQKCFF